MTSALHQEPPSRAEGTIYTEPCREGVIRGIAPCPEAARASGFWVLAATILGSAMAFIDGTVVNVALPIIQKDLQASAADLQWIVESYALFLAALLLVGGAMGDHFGRKRVYVWGIALFAAASLWCGLAGSTAELIVARAVKGVGAALLVPGSLALIGANFTADKRGAAIGTWSAATAITMAFGPVLGGWLAENVSWRWIFYLNLPIAVLVIVITQRFVPESRNESDTQPLDWWGAGLSVIGLGGVVLGLIEAGRFGLTHPLVLGSLAAGLAGLGLFARHEMRARNAMMPPALFRSRTFSGANAMTLMIYFALGGALFFLPLKLIQVDGYTATAAAAAFLPFVVIMALLSRFSGQITDRLGPRVPLTAGPVITAAGFGLLALLSGEPEYWRGTFPAIVMMGAGMVLTVAPLTTAVMTSVEENRTGTASGINNAVSRIAALLAIAGFGLIFVETAWADLQTRLALVLPPEALGPAQEIRQVFGALEIPPALEAAHGEAIRAQGRLAFAHAYDRVMALAALVTILAALIAWTMIEPRQKPSTD